MFSKCSCCVFNVFRGLIHDFHCLLAFSREGGSGHKCTPHNIRTLPKVEAFEEGADFRHRTNARAQNDRDLMRGQKRRKKTGAARWVATRCYKNTRRGPARWDQEMPKQNLVGPKAADGKLRSWALVVRDVLTICSRLKRCF